jgi:isopentenyl diphosphate isomerase/L-lactate dehydrogenase-like FMN-dependent dehydrogenase
MATARAAAGAGVLQCLSTMASRSLEAVAEAARGPRWFQLYVHKDRSVTAELVRRAAAAGYGAIVLTVDLPLPGYRERELRRGFEVPVTEQLGNLTGVAAGGRNLMKLIEDLHDQSLTWRGLEWVRGLTDLPLVVKGILTAEDAALAVAYGVAGVVVSNHGGRQLDGTPATIDVLEEVVDAVAGRAEVYLDGGVRRGTDVLAALALGARGTFIGRPYLFALAAGGEAGVAAALGLLRRELETAMRLLGVTRVADVTRAHVRRAREGT